MRKVYKSLPFLLSLVILIVTIFQCYFVERSEMLDELSLYNPVYMFLNFNKLSYPAHGFFHSMIPHPPLHYLSIGLLMKLGLNSFYAITTPAFLITVLGLLIILINKVQTSTKIILLTGLAGPFIIDFYAFHALSIRPDFVLALSWYVGLVSLEIARLSDWEPKRLFLGAFLLTYASGLHYFAGFAFTSVLAYFIYLAFKSSATNSIKKLKPIIYGGLTIGLPYLVFFVFPNLYELYIEISGHESVGSMADAVKLHTDMYHFQSLGDPLIPPFHLLETEFSLKFFSVLFLFCGPILLLLNKSLRVMAFAALPLLCFVFFMARTKSEGYYIPETMIYCAGLTSAILFILKNISVKAGVRGIKYFGSLILVILIGSYIVLEASPKFQKQTILKPKQHEMHLARSLCKSILGDDALVAGRMALWYASGAQLWYDPSSELLWSDSLEYPFEEIISGFDAIVEYNGGSNVSYNKENKSILSYYADSSLNLIGFNLTDDRDFDSDLSFLIMSLNKKKPVEGFITLGGDSVLKFEEDSSGLYTYLALTHKMEDNISFLTHQSLHYNVMPLPGPGLEWWYRHGHQVKVEEQLVWMVLPVKVYNELIKSPIPGLRIREAINGTVQEFDYNPLLEKLYKTDQPIQFIEFFTDINNL